MDKSGYLKGWSLSAAMLLAAVAARADAFDFDVLMEALADRPRFAAEFVEERSSFFLSRPITLRGTLHFDADRRLDKRVTSPYTERIVIDSDAVVIERVNEEGRAATTQRTRYSLANNPTLAKAVQGVSNVFAGDRTLLEDMYTWSLEGDAESWELVLEPRGEELAEYIAAITLRGSGGVIQYIQSLEADGDESKMTLDAAPEG